MWLVEGQSVFRRTLSDINSVNYTDIYWFLPSLIFISTQQNID